MIDLFKGFFKREASGQTAKERLRLVLMSDHLSLAPEIVEAMKRDLLEVISRYVEIDHDHADVTFESREREVAMLANIPIVALRDRDRTPPPGGPSGSRGAGGNAAPRPAPSRAEPTVATPALESRAAVVDGDQSSPSAGATPQRRPRKRRRRRKPRVLASLATI